MTTYSNKIWGILFLALAALTAAPSLSWAQKMTQNDIEAQNKQKSDDLLGAVGMEGAEGEEALKVVGKRHDVAENIQMNNSSTGASINLTTDEAYEATKYALEKMGLKFIPNTGDPNREKYDALRQEKLGEIARENQLNSIYRKAKREKCEELTGKTCDDLKGYLEIWGFFGNKRLEDTEYKKYLQEIEEAGKEARKAAEGNKYYGLLEVTFEDMHGNRYKAEVKKGVIGDVTYDGSKKDAGAWKGCEALPVKLYKQKQCFFCPLFAVLYQAADDMAVKSFEKLGVAFKTLIALGLGLFIAFQTLIHVSSITKQDGPKFLSGLMKQSFKFLIAFLLLANSGQIYIHIVNPLLSAGISFGESMLFLTTDSSTDPSSVTVATTYYGAPLYRQLEGFITRVQREIAFMQAVGSSLLCIGGHKMIGIGGFDFGTGFQMALQGILLAVFGFLLSLAFGFYLIDAVVQLGVVGALMPFLIACWPFKLTAQYTSKGANMLLNSFFIFVFIGLVVSVNLSLVDAALQNTTPSSQAEEDKNAKIMKKCETEGQSETDFCKNFEKSNKARMGGLRGIYNAINAQEPDRLKELTDISGMGFIILVICCIFGFKFCNQASSLAEKMASGGIKGIGASIGTMGASAAVGVAKKTTAPIREAAGNKLDDWGDKAFRGVVGAPGALYRKITNKPEKSKRVKTEKNPDEKPTTPTPDTPLGGGGGNGTPTISESTVKTPPTNEDKTAGDKKKGSPSIEENNEKNGGGSGSGGGNGGSDGGNDGSGTVEQTNGTNPETTQGGTSESAQDGETPKGKSEEKKEKGKAQYEQKMQRAQNNSIKTKGARPRANNSGSRNKNSSGGSQQGRRKVLTKHKNGRK